MLHRLRLPILLSIFCHLALAQVPYPNECPKLKLLEEFNVDAYMGIWYEYSKYPFFLELGKRCVYAKYENVGNNTVSVMNSGTNRFTNLITNITGRAKIVGPGQLLVEFAVNINSDSPNYVVLGTDYTSYAVVFSCTSFVPLAHTRIVWILTRERIPTPETISAAKKIIQENDLSEIFLMNTIQNDCNSPEGNNDQHSRPTDTGAQSVPQSATVATNAIEQA